MKILWHSAHPAMRTGYGTQSALILPRLKALGYEIAIHCTAGQTGFPGQWEGMPVFGNSGYTEMGEDTVGPAYGMWNADLCITFMCTWNSKMPPLWRNLRTLHLMNVDCDPMSWSDYAVIADTGGMPAATSRRGWEIMRKGGKTPARPDDRREPLDPLYLPHGIDLQAFSPAAAARRAELRERNGVDKSFNVAMNFNNNDRFPDRKNIARQLRGFAMFRNGDKTAGIEPHPDAVLNLHAVERLADGYNLRPLLAALGIPAAAVRWTDPELIVMGLIDSQRLADWYRAQDVYLGAGNEGVGLPGLEAQACGVPAILLDAQSGPEIAGKVNWLVGGHPEYNEVHQADWLRADSAQVAQALCEAYEQAGDRREAVRENVRAWDINRVVREHWEPALAELA